jgi:hypothetical protein
MREASHDGAVCQRGYLQNLRMHVLLQHTLVVDSDDSGGCESSWNSAQQHSCEECLQFRLDHRSSTFCGSLTCMRLMRGA